MAPPHLAFICHFSFPRHLHLNLLFFTLPNQNMAVMRTKILVLLLVLSGMVLSVAATHDPEKRVECRQARYETRQGEHDRMQCERQCQERYGEGGELQEREDGMPVADAMINSGFEEELSECRKECQKVQFDPRREQKCERNCVQSHEQQRKRQGDSLGELINPNPEYGYSQCLEHCQQHYPHDARQKQQCRSQCRKRYQQETERHGGSEKDEVQYNRDPEWELSQCRSQCQERHPQDHRQLQQCERQCKGRYEQQRHRAEQDEKHMNRDPERGYQCHQRCQEQHGYDPDRRKECQRQCKGHKDERDEEPHHNPKEYSKCCQQCKECYQHDSRGLQKCQRHRKERYEEQQEGGSKKDDMLAINQDPQRELSECLMKCQGSHQQGLQCRKQCRRCCTKLYEEEKERERGRREKEQNRKPDAFLEFLKQYQKYHKHDRQWWEACESRCEKHYGKPGERAEENDVIGRDPWEDEQKCMARCRRMGYCQKCERWCKKQCQQRGWDMVIAMVT